MSSPPRSRNDFTFPWTADHEPGKALAEGLERFYRLCHRRWQVFEVVRQASQPALAKAGAAAGQTVRATALIVLPRVFAGWDALRPAVLAQARSLMPFAPLPSPEEEALRADPVWALLAEFQALEPDQQVKSAKNLALLWDHFGQTFGGVSGYLAEPQVEQLVYLDKLTTASRRMRLARGSEVAFHYVTVELMRLYVQCFQQGRSDRVALTLAAHVASLINRGRMVTPALTDDVERAPMPQAAAA